MPEDRTFVLFFFSTLQRESASPWIEKLNKLRGRKEFLVVGLSPETKERVSKFVEEQKVQFMVGIKSKAYKKFDIKTFPRVVVIPPRKCDQPIAPEALSLEHFDRRFSSLPDADPLISGAFDENSSINLLRRHASEDPDESAAHQSLNLLRSKLPPDEFLALCDQLLQEEENVFRKGNLLFQRQRGDPGIAESDKEPLFSPSALAQHEERTIPDDPKWAPIAEFNAQLSHRTEAELFEDFLDHLSDDPVDARIRSSIPHALGRSSDKRQARSLLMQMLPLETDFGVRQQIVGRLSDVCNPGDLEVADFLEDHLRIETNVRVVRPMMEYVIRYLRTGEE